MAGFIALPVIQKEAWAQCENPNCQKWRRLPPGAPEINEDEPWYCYLNPDATRNTCSASEVVRIKCSQFQILSCPVVLKSPPLFSPLPYLTKLHSKCSIQLQDYDENNEIVIAGMDDPEEAARNRAIMEDLEASIAAAAAAAVRGRGKGGRGGARGGRGRGARGRGRPPLPGGGFAAGGRGFGALPAFDQYGIGGGGGSGAGGGGSRRMRNVSFAEDYDIDAGDSDLTAGRHGSRMTKRQIAKHLQRLVENQGQWEAPRGGAAAALPVIPPSLPSEAWEALANAAPDTAELVCAAADLASSVRYFESAGSAAEHAVAEAGLLARLGAVLAASSGLVDCQDALTKVERERLGLDEAVVTAPLPDPTLPLDINNVYNASVAAGAGGGAGAVVEDDILGANGERVPDGDVQMMDDAMVEEEQQLRPDGVLQGVVI
jgi:CW-type Zinc Finger